MFSKIQVRNGIVGENQEPGVLVHTFYLSTQEAAAGSSA